MSNSVRAIKRRSCRGRWSKRERYIQEQQSHGMLRAKLRQQEAPVTLVESLRKLAKEMGIG